MDDDSIQDLKQYISATVHQEVSGLKDDINNLDKKLDESVASIGDAITGLSEHVEKRVDDHEGRITKLEQNPA